MSAQNSHALVSAFFLHFCVFFAFLRFFVFLRFLRTYAYLCQTVLQMALRFHITLAIFCLFTGYLASTRSSAKTNKYKHFMVLLL